MIKRSIHEEEITIVNIYVTNLAVPQYIRQIEQLSLCRVSF